MSTSTIITVVAIGGAAYVAYGLLYSKPKRMYLDYDPTFDAKRSNTPYAIMGNLNIIYLPTHTPAPITGRPLTPLEYTISQQVHFDDFDYYEKTGFRKPPKDLEPIMVYGPATGARGTAVGHYA